MNHRSLLLAGILAVFGSSLLAAQTGTVQGTVTEARTGDPVSGVQISVGETGVGSLSSSEGSFTIQNVPVGTHTVTASSIGYGTVSREIRVQRGETVSLEIDVAQEAVEIGGITVTGRRGGYLPEETTIGTKVAGSLIEVPQSVSVITRERMESQGVETQAEALRYTAGVQAESYGPDLLYDWTQIRGFQQYGQNLFRDGMQLRSASQATLRLNPFGAERIEVLRGPASVLYGQSSAGGFVNYVSKRPSAQPFGEVMLQTGSYDRLQGTIDVTGPVTEQGDLLYRVAGLARSADAQVDFSENDQIYVAPSLTWEPGSNTSLTVLGDYQRDDAVRGTSFLPASGTLQPNPNGTIPADRFDGVPGFNGFERDQHSFGYLFDHGFADDWTVHSRARYTSMENDYQIAWGAGLQADQRTMNRFWFSGLPTLEILTVDNHMVAGFSTGGIGHEILVGVDYQRHILDERWDYGTADPLDVFDPNYGGDPLNAAFFSSDTRREQDQVGLYIQDQIELDAWTLVVSGRQDWVDTESRDRIAGSTTEQSTDALSGRIGLVYQSDAGLAPYASYSESFLPLLGTTATGAAFEPETGQQYEVGVKYQPDAANSYVTLAAFDLQRQNVLTPNPTDATFQVQTGEIRSRGVEVEGVASLLAGLDLAAAYTFLDTEVTKSNAGDEGNRPIIVPEHAGSVWADYTLQGGEVEGLGFGIGVRYTGSTWGNAANTLKVPGYTLLDGTVHYDWQDFRLGLTASNVFDETYVASCYDATSCFYGATRTIRADVAYRW